jgi:hypothetical protein
MTEEEQPHTSLVEMAKRSVEISFEGFDEPDDDITPEVTWRQGYGDKGLGMMVLAVNWDTADEKLAITQMIMCNLGVQQAVEATMAHTIWAVAEDQVDAWVEAGRPAPADFPGHHEEIFLFHASPDGEGLHRARITRYPDKPPTLGKWTTVENDGRVVGIFRDAIANGVRMGRSIPDDLAQRMRDDMDRLGSETVLAGMIRSFRAAQEIAYSVREQVT